MQREVGRKPASKPMHLTFPERCPAPKKRSSEKETTGVPYREKGIVWKARKEEREWGEKPYSVTRKFGGA